LDDYTSAAIEEKALNNLKKARPFLKASLKG